MICNEGGFSMNYVYLLNTDKLNNKKLFSKYYTEMSEYRKNKINKMKMQKDKNLSLGVGILINNFLKPLELREKDILYVEKCNGKPFFKNLPEVFFNASHSGNCAVCSFSDEEIGCDVEKSDRANTEIAKRFFVRTECDYIFSAKTEKEMSERFFRLWTLKESYLKLSGKGLQGGLDSFEIIFDKSFNNGIAVKEKSEFKKVYFKEYKYLDYYISVCSRSSVFSDNLIIMELWI